MADTIVSLILCNPELDFIYRHIYNGQEFTFNTMNIKAMLDEISITEIEVITWIKTYIGENLKGLYGGVSI
jgi:demethoxyubiquinone hydroxylase (CLK1/Coq7/Cat5 family)